MPGPLTVRDADLCWREVPAEWPGRTAAGEPKVVYKVLIDWNTGLPNMQRVRFEPHHFEPPHSHEEDEVIYLLQGDLSFGDQSLTQNDTLFIPKKTQYSLRAGEAGAEFVRVGLTQEARDTGSDESPELY
jgi:quercetin dioxygenase-like cupin family protein